MPAVDEAPSSAPNGERPLSASAFRLGDWVVEPPLNRVSRGERTVHVRRQLIDLLVFLASRPGQVVPKEEIFRAVWPGQFVAESGLARCISQLRDVLEDDPRQPRFIETIPTRGYRLVAPVVPCAVAAPPALLAPTPAEGRPEAGAPAAVIEAAPPAPAAAVGRRWRLSRLAVFASIGGLAALALWLAVRTPALEGQDTLVVSFENHTGDPVFDDTLRLALSIQLEQSPYLRVVPEQRIREALAYMNRRPDEPVTGAVAMDLCERVGAKAVLSGTITNLGGQYVIGVESLACPSGRTLVRRQKQTGRKGQVIGTLGDVVSELRSRLGESVASVQKHDVPLVQATTSSLDALKALTSGDLERRRGRDAEAIQAYQRAIEADPQFALAYGRLGVHLLSLMRTGEANDALKQAFALRHRASAGERQYITSYYYTRVVRDPLKAVAALEAWRDEYPRNPAPRISLGELYVQTGRFDRALAEGREALRLQAGDATATSVVVDSLIGLDRFDEAKRLAEAEVSAGRGSVTMRVALLLIAFAQDDAAAIRRHEEWAASNPAAESLTAVSRAANAMFGGRMRDADFHWHQRVERAEARGDHALAALTMAGVAIHEAFVGRDAEVRTLAAAALQKPGTPDTVLRSAFALALIGDTAEAERRFAEYVRMPDVEAGSDPQWRAPAQALIEIERGRPDRAIDLLESVRPYELGLACVPTYVRGLAFMRAKQPRQAAAEFAVMTSHRGALINALVYPLAWLQLARAHAGAGDTQSARQAYERFLRVLEGRRPGPSGAGGGSRGARGAGQIGSGLTAQGRAKGLRAQGSGPCLAQARAQGP